MSIKDHIAAVKMVAFPLVLIASVILFVKIEGVLLKLALNQGFNVYESIAVAIAPIIIIAYIFAYKGIKAGKL